MNLQWIKLQKQLMAIVLFIHCDKTTLYIKWF